MAKLKVIFTSTRDGREGTPVAHWFVEQAKKHGGFEVDFVDLREQNLPLFDEPRHPMKRNYEHEHTKACHIYGFHDFRRAFATVNAPRLKPETLQKLMRHRSYITTLGYINLASQLDDAITSMPVPKVLRKGEAKDDEGEAEKPKKEPDDQ